MKVRVNNMLVEFEIRTQNYQPLFITKNIDEYLSVPHLKQSLLLEAIKLYGIYVTEIQEIIHTITDIKGVSSSYWKYFKNIDINKLLPLNNIIINKLNPQELESYNNQFQNITCPVKCLENVLLHRYITMDIAIRRYICSVTDSTLLHLLQDILYSKLSIQDIRNNPRLVINLLAKQDNNLKETFLQTVRTHTKEIIIL